jgi:hypothetical protein
LKVTQIEEYGNFIRELMPQLAGNERLLAREIYNALATSGVISVGALGERARLTPSKSRRSSRHGLAYIATMTATSLGSGD